MFADYLKETHATGSEPKLNRRATNHGKAKLLSPSSISGETLNESDENVNKANEDSSLNSISSKHRLQRQKGHNRKSLRLRKSTRSKDHNLICKSDTVDLTDLKQQFSPVLKNEHESSTSSPGCASMNQAYFSSSTPPTENDTNGNFNEVLPCKDVVPDNSTMDRAKKLHDNVSNNNTPSAIIANHGDGSTKPLNLALPLNRMASTDNQSNLLSPFEATINTLPFADEDV